MKISTASRPLWFAVADDFPRARETLLAAEFTEQNVIERLHVNELATHRNAPSILLHRTSQGSPLDVLIRLFLLNVPVPADTVRQAMAPVDLETWIAAGLLRLEGESVLAVVKLQPFRGLVLAFDLWREDYVMGIARSSINLADLAIRRPSTRTLDLGTGSGIQAFLAARHSQRVVAVDCNPRAAAIAEFNAALNGFTNVECLAGDLFEPVQGQRFDLVVSNPPYVIRPQGRDLMNAQGMQGDRLTHRIIREVPALLNDGGYCQILCDWAHVAGQDTNARLSGWIAGTGCDAWVMSWETCDPADYAATWIQHTETDTPERFADWLAFYQEQRIEALSTGVITLRRTDRPRHWLRIDDAPSAPTSHCGESIDYAFRVRDYLESLPDNYSLLGKTLRVSPDLRLHQQCQAADGRWSVVKADLRLSRGLPFHGYADDPNVALLLAGCDGRRPLREALRPIAKNLKTSPERLSAQVLPQIREMVEHGFLVPTDLDTAQTQ